MYDPTMQSDLVFIVMLIALGWWLSVTGGEQEGVADAFMRPAPFCVSWARAMRTAILPRSVVDV